MKKTSGTFLVTGATGFIGRRLVTRLLALHDPEAITCVVQPICPPEHAATLADFRSAGIRLIEGDLNTAIVSPEPPPSVDVVFHLAANIDTSLDEQRLRVNDVGTGRLLDWLRPVLHGARVVYSSSIAVLDRAAPADAPLTESSPCTPRTAYGLTKLRGEQIIAARAASTCYTYTIVRLATVYGPGAKRGGLLDVLFRLNAQHPLLARIDWPGRCSVIHVDDAVNLLLAASECEEASNEIYCCANPYTPTVGELAQHIGQVSGRPIHPVRIPRWAWRAVRTLAWAPGVRLVGSLVAPTTFWRFTLLVDDGFWVDASKMRAISSSPPIDLDAGLTQMLATFAELARPLS